MAVQRGTACVVFDIETDGTNVEASPGTSPAPRWTGGPLRLPMGGGVTDRERRLTYFEPRVAESLYGTAERPSRMHRRLPSAPAPRDRPAVEAVELLRLPPVIAADTPGRGIAVLHVRLSGDPLDELARIGDLVAMRDEYGQLLPAGVRPVLSARRAWTLCHVTFTDGRPPEVMPPEYSGWGARDQWLWLLASATPFSRFPPDPEDDGLFAGRVRFSADWQALVLRDGAAFLGTSPDSAGEDGFHPAAEVLAHTIYLDAFLLGRLQVLGVNFLANALAGLRAHETQARRLLALEGRQIELRRALWSSHITVHGKANELLERFQQQHRLPELLSQTGTGLADAARYVETSRARRSGLAVALLSTVGLPFAIFYSAAALWGEPTPRTLLTSTVAALVVTLLLFAVLPPLRGLVSAELRKPKD
ncbi:hypothetical protein ACFYY3_32135 [Streptomyces sp. NPDC001812]|uniref:Membrane transport protein MMPL domain-containing protein n=1 Tax=Streptomyces cathayae TaxID=3031124 RepID=A0ABY8JWQ8_9ACTN|nr:hypothetical protein [Streptomyces sp. HUAS 5]WGD39864.1 hypothetical protein PYS65_06805 [Streptomyces sp. HUAS 5]